MSKTKQHMTSKMRRIKHIHFVGVGGVGMCGIAEVLLKLGYHVSGSDLTQNAATQHLQKLGATIFLGHKAEHVKGAEVVVYSGMIHEDNPEVHRAREDRIPVIHRAEMLAELMRFHHGIAVAGTHGKTTTTGLVTCILTEAGLEPTCVIGGVLNSHGSNAYCGTGDYLVAEADESDASFLYLQPITAIVTNIDMDHLGTYQGNFTQLKNTFVEFLQHLPFYGLAVLCIDDPVIQEILPKIRRSIVTYGFSETADVRIINFKQEGMRSYFEILRGNKFPPLKIQLSLPGKHSALNAAAAIAVATDLNIETNAIVAALEKFAGVGRRMQIHGEIAVNGGTALVMDDYGHHPREIAVTFDAVRAAFPDRRLVVAFQPHRYTRTQELFQDFVQVLKQMPHLILLDIYAAGEQEIININTPKLCEAIEQSNGKRPGYIRQVDQLQQFLSSVLNPGDVLLLQGAGNIGPFAARLITEGLKYG